MKTGIIGVLLLLSAVCYAQSAIEGIWSSNPYQNPNPKRTLERDLSWGKKNVPLSFVFIIDLHSDVPTIEINNFTMDNIINVSECGTKTELTFYFARGELNVTMVCHFNNDGTMWVEPLHDGLTFFGTGENFIYYRIDGPPWGILTY
jgi:hypothetical protein